MKKIVQITTAHPRSDTRIFLKMSKSLSKKYDMTLLVADKPGNDYTSKIKVESVLKTGEKKSRIFRFTIINLRLLIKCILNKFDIYHFHDPDFIPAAFILKIFNKKVIYDVHEDYPKNILQSEYLPKWTQSLISWFIEKLEIFTLRFFDGVIAATPSIQHRLLKHSTNCININNYPIINELNESSNKKDQKDGICFVGSISKVRGITELIRSLEYSKTKLYLAGSASDLNYFNGLKTLNGWKYVHFLGQINREQIKQLFSKCFAGVVTFLPTPNHIDALPNKLFEYMSAGLPLIASDFESWHDLITKNRVGLTVNPKSPKLIARATLELINNSKLRAEFSINSIKIINSKLNWSKEESKLFNLYEELLK